MRVYGNNANSGIIHRENVQAVYTPEEKTQSETETLPAIEPKTEPNVESKGKPEGKPEGKAPQWTYYVDGESFNSIKAAAEFAGIKYSTLYDAFALERKLCKGHEVKRVRV